MSNMIEALEKIRSLHKLDKYNEYLDGYIEGLITALKQAKQRDIISQGKLDVNNMILNPDPFKRVTAKKK